MVTNISDLDVAQAGFSEWRKAVDDRLLDIFAITLEDCGVEDRYLISHWQTKQSSEEFVEWYGRKYDLACRFSSYQSDFNP